MTLYKFFYLIFAYQLTSIGQFVPYALKLRIVHVI